MRPILGLLALLALFCSPLRAAELADGDAAIALTEQIMQKVASGDLRGGLEVARPYVIVPMSEFETVIDKAEMQQPVMSARFGKSLGHELIRQNSVGQSLLQVVHLQRFEKHAMVWNFIFYRGEKGWVLNSFNFRDDLSVVL